MTRRALDVIEEIKALPDTEKLEVVDSILLELDKPDPEIDRVWADEARARWRAYGEGRAATVSYAEVMARDRDTQAELQAIDREFTGTDSDGLSKD